MGYVIGLLSLALILICLLLGLLILIQLPKKEAGMGMAFGSGAVDTLLGAGGGNALTRFTKWFAGIFLVLCIVLAWLYNFQAGSGARTRGVRDALTTTAEAPVAPKSTTPGISALSAPTNAAVALSTSTIPVAPKALTNSPAPAGK
ncbi:MAG TPA: preprotein translocase subunit SecG [Candidatus Limnocylindria bacterium]|jgi:preprotein translocase subunit SecG|nr:preprotein translocase subunit SecG [Candidatus Limnocylindria bacterium]